MFDQKKEIMWPEKLFVLRKGRKSLSLWGREWKKIIAPSEVLTDCLIGVTLPIIRANHGFVLVIHKSFKEVRRLIHFHRSLDLNT